jgi:hypothetical protein
MDSYYSLRATQRTSKDFTLSLDIARPLRSRLKMWNDSLPPALALRQPERADSRGMARLSGNPSLSLAYIVATMTLYRALLRPLENLTSIEEEDHGIVGSRLAVRKGAKECAREVVEFVENLGRGALDAFWHSCNSPTPFPKLDNTDEECCRVTSELCNRLFIPNATSCHVRERSRVK